MNGLSFFSSLVQQFCVPVVTFFCLVATETVVRDLNPGVSPPPRFAEDVSEMIVALGVGFLLGVLANRFLPHFAADGRFTWILPSAILLMTICADVFHKDAPQVLIGYFYPDNHDEEGLVFSFVTLPTYSCVAYSLGILFAKARFGPKGTDGREE